MDTLCLQNSICGIITPVNATSRANDYASRSRVSALRPRRSPLPSRFSFRYPLKSLWPPPIGKVALDDAVLVDNEGGEGEGEAPNGNWVSKIFHVTSLWRREQRNHDNGEEQINEEEECDGCRVDDGDDDDDDDDDDDEDEDEVVFDRESFSRMLRRVSLSDARFYARMSHLGNLAYSIPKIKSGNLLKSSGLRFVTSSIEKKGLGGVAERKQIEGNNEKDGVEETKEGYKMSASAAYEIAASAASDLLAQTRTILPFKSSDSEVGEGEDKVAALRATTDSMTAVVAANEEAKQAFADDLNSTTSSPCEWFVCDDDETYTRYFVIQGSESFASWQANLLFEPIQFEGMDVHVHRGIYEAAKGTYQQMLPEIGAHLNRHGSGATFRFTGHSLGGSLALLVNLMLLIRKEVPFSSLLPVITFGSPWIMCGGDTLLHNLGLPRSHVQAIIMHRDIVPRVFSSKFPNHAAKLLKALNANFRNHPCLNKQKILYTPMGEVVILQPEEKFSPSHDLLPSGSGLYVLSGCVSEESYVDRNKRLRMAQLVFLNSPHPLEILSERSAYGSGGTIQRDHDMNSYLKALTTLIRQQLNHIRKLRREKRRMVWWPLVLPRGSGRDAPVLVNHEDQPQLHGIVGVGRESLKRFSRLVASQHMQFFLLFLFPARLLLLGASNFVSFR